MAIKKRTPLLISGLGVLTVVSVVIMIQVSDMHRDEAPSPKANVVLITVDTLRADHVSAYGYDRPTTPHIDELASAGVRFGHHLVPRGETWPSLTTILTGTYPRTHGVRGNGQALDSSRVTLIEILQDAGFTTAAFLTNFTTAPNRGLDELKVWANNHSDPFHHYVADAEATTSAREWLREHSNERFMIWLHLLGPHEPYEPDPNLPRQFATGYDGDLTGSRRDLVNLHRSRRELGADELEHIISLYDDDVYAIDRNVGALLDEIESAGVANDTIVVFTADHGEELYDHDSYFLHSFTITRSVLWTPLMLRWPGVLPSGRVIDELVQAVDIAPTLLSLLGLPISESMEGVDLSGLSRGDQAHPAAFPIAYSELGPEIHALQTPRWKYVYNPKGYSSPGAEGGEFGIFRFLPHRGGGVIRSSGRSRRTSQHRGRRTRGSGGIALASHRLGRSQARSALTVGSHITRKSSRARGSGIRRIA